MYIRGSHVPPFTSLPPDAIQAFIDGLAVLSLRNGIVLDMASMMPIHVGAAGYFAAPGGYLTVASHEEVAEMARVPQRCGTPDTLAYISAFASMTAHDRLRILREIG